MHRPLARLLQHLPSQHQPPALTPPPLSPTLLPAPPHPHPQASHLLKYDSTLGKFDADVKVVDDQHIAVNGKSIRVVSSRDPTKLPWKEMEIDLVIEGTGVFIDTPGASKHIEVGVTCCNQTVFSLAVHCICCFLCVHRTGQQLQGLCDCDMPGVVLTCLSRISWHVHAPCGPCEVDQHQGGLI
jgi:hypothetical protein